MNITTLVRKFILFLVALTVSFVLIGLLFAAEEVDLDKIVVSSSRIAENSTDISRKVEIITAEDIAAAQAKDLPAMLSRLSAVNMGEYGGLGQIKTIRMRGSTAAQVLVMVDGRPMNSPRDGELDLSTIALDNIARIEVLHGPASSLYGAGAMGGTVNIITKNPPPDKPKTELSSSYGTYNTYTETFSHGARLGDFGYLLSGGYKKSEGLRSNSELDSRDLNTKLEYKINDQDVLTLNTGVYKSRAGSPGKITEVDIDDKLINLKNFVDLSGSFKPDGASAVSAKIYQNYDRMEFHENTAGSIWDTAYKKDIHHTQSRGAELQLSRKFSDAYQAVCGFNYVGNFNNSTATAKHKYLVRAGYLENKLDLGEKIKIDFGARLDDYSNFGSEVNPSLSALYEVRQNIKLRGAVSRSFRAPTFNDLYWPDEGWTKGNPNLKPEKGWTKEIAIETKVAERIASSITYYRSDYDDLINWAEEAGVWMPKNVNSAQIEAVEYDNQIKLSDLWNLNLDYAFLRAKDKQTHKYLVYQPKHKLSFALRYKDQKGWSGEIRGQFVDRRFHDSGNSVYLKRYFTFGVNLAKEFRPAVTAFIAIDNVLARKYQTLKDYPMPGFSLTSGLKLSF